MTTRLLHEVTLEPMARQVTPFSLSTHILDGLVGVIVVRVHGASVTRVGAGSGLGGLSLLMVIV